MKFSNFPQYKIHICGRVKLLARQDSFDSDVFECDSGSSEINHINYPLRDDIRVAVAGARSRAICRGCEQREE